MSIGESSIRDRIIGIGPLCQASPRFSRMFNGDIVWKIGAKHAWNSSD